MFTLYETIPESDVDFMRLDVNNFKVLLTLNFFQFRTFIRIRIFAGSLEAAYSLNWGAREIWGKGGGETLALL